MITTQAQKNTAKAHGAERSDNLPMGKMPGQEESEGLTE